MKVTVIDSYGIKTMTSAVVASLNSKTLIMLHFISAVVCMKAYAQLPVADFATKSTVCRNEILQFSNNSENAVSHMWDFCEGDMNETPVASVIATLTASFNPSNLTLINNNSDWFCFIVSRGTNSLFRIDFGNDPRNPTPSVVNLGNPSNALSGPEAIKVLSENGNWYGFVLNNTSQNIVRLNFGSNPANNSPSTEIAISSTGSSNGCMDISVSSAGTVAVVGNLLSNRLQIINFGNSVTNNPGPSDIILSPVVTGVNGIDEVSLQLVDGEWHGFIVGFNSRTVHRLDFGANLFSVPSATLLTGLNFGIDRPSSVQLVRDMGSLVGFITTNTGNLYRLDFGVAITSNTPSMFNMGNFSILNNSVSLQLVKDGSIWSGFVLDQTNRRVSSLSFPNPCGLINSQQEVPTGISYAESKTYYVSLTVSGNTYNSDYSAQQVVVTNSAAPDIAISSQFNCVNNDVNFASTNISNDVVNYQWDFGDATTVWDPTPIHIYTTTSTYYPSLTVTASNGCQNFAQDTLQIFNAPQASFDLPQVSPLCSNQNYIYANTSIFDDGSNPSWQWSVNGTDVATTQDLNYLFTSSATQNVTLTASIPGCSTEFTQNIMTLLDGPLVGFDSPNTACQGSPVSFTNTTVGSTSTLSWTFGDGNISSEESVINSYNMAGEYAVTLNATNEAGCQNSSTKEITIHSLPQPNFQLELPPFSCSGMPSQFNDLTPSPVDSNITSWDWNFGDTGSGTNISALKNPTHIYDNAGQYEVTLTAGTNYGCVDSLKKAVTITQTPDIEILNTPACDDVPVTFSTSSSGDLQSWNWQIGVTQFSQPEPIYLFTNPGSFNVNLDAVGNNNCIASTSKNVIVPQSLFPDFVVEKNCVGQSSEFTDVTTIYDDPIATYAWSFGDAGTGSESPVNHVYQSTGNYNVNLNITTLSGCNYSGIKSIAVGNPPQASFTASPDVGVPPLNVTFINSSFGATQYQWNFNDENNATSSEASPQFTFLEYGNYVVDLTAYNAQNCSHTVSKVVMAALPFIDLGLENLIVSENASGLLTGRVVIHNKGNITVQNLNLLINLSGIEIQQTVTESIPPYSSILFTLDFNIVRGNKLEYICVEADLAGDNNEEDNSVCTSFEDQVVILAPYPNPTQGSLYVDWISPEDQLTQLFIYDPLGKLVSQNEVEASKGFNSALLNLESLTQGVYYLTFHSGQMKRTLRFAVSR